MRRLVLALALAALLAGSIRVTHPSTGAFDPLPVETPFGRLAPGSTLGVNATNATVSVAGSLLSTTTPLVYLNNTNATTPIYARLEVVTARGLASLTSLAIGIDNGTRTDQITSSTGSLTKSTGKLVRLPPGSVNRLYATHTLAGAGLQAVVDFRVIMTDDLGEASSTVTRSRLKIV